MYVAQLIHQYTVKIIYIYYTIQHADPEFFSPSRIDVLLEADVYSSLLSGGIHRGTKVGCSSVPLARPSLTNEFRPFTVRALRTRHLIYEGFGSWKKCRVLRL